MNANTFCLVFDFDGTLLNSIPVAYKGTCHIFEMANLPPPTFEEYYAKFGHPYPEFYWKRGVPFSEEEMWNMYHSVAKHDEAELFQDVTEALRLFHLMGFPMAIVSSQREKVVHLHCDKSGISKYFKIIKADLQNKVSALKEVALCVGSKPEATLYVGDFCADMRDAVAAGVVPVGITRTYPIREHLVSAGAKYCIDDLNGLCDVIHELCQPA